jgi:hypothetical protein
MANGRLQIRDLRFQRGTGGGLDRAGRDYD